MCIVYKGHCACCCGCTSELESRMEPCTEECGRIAFPVHYDVFDYRCGACWPARSESDGEAVAEWSRRRRGEYWWYVPLWKRRSMFEGPLPGVVCRKGRTGSGRPDLPPAGTVPGSEAEEDAVTRRYRALESLYGDALGLGLTLRELEAQAGVFVSEHE
ncbi:hypothetical protein DL769_004551 [Monosporascus sp. CRB-8-3]|nr:hypothetical protein DL769_004551 [Monosporascus sp. CRB-8-3]